MNKRSLKLICLLLTLGLAVSILSCSGWTVMGYALDKGQQDSTTVVLDSVENFINE